jgi:uncharacterized protein YdbL (DUF1318 family)
MCLSLKAVEKADNSKADKAIAQVMQRIKARYPKLLKAKKEGAVGETTLGYIEQVDTTKKASEELKKLIENENKDRTELYKLLAGKMGTKPEIVANRNALRKFKNAASGDYLKKSDGTWVQK